MPIVLFTDCGLDSHIPGLMKGVMNGIAPDAQVVDLAHNADATDIRLAALTLMQSARYFPVGTIFCITVGAHQGRPVLAQAGGYWFVAPDNGILSYLLYDLPHAWSMDVSHALDDGDGAIYGGWEILASVAALVHAGAPAETLGEPVQRLLGLPLPKFEIKDGWLYGEVMAVDATGAIHTSLGLFRWKNETELTLRPLVGTGVWTVQAAEAYIALEQWAVHGIHRSGMSDGQRIEIGGAGFLVLHTQGGEIAAQTQRGQSVRVKIE